LRKRFAKLEMLLGRERVIALGSETMMLDIVVLVLAVRHFVERQVRNFGKRGVKIAGGSFLRNLKNRNRRLQRGDFGQQRLGPLLVFRLLSFADFLRRRVAPRLSGLGGLDRATALFVERDERLRQRRKPAPR
jgi:hypothetical protein